MDSGRADDGTPGMTPGVPSGVQQFLGRYIDSVEQLEILLLLHEHPAREWTVAEVTRALYAHPASVGRRLGRLSEARLLGRIEGAEPRYRYAPANDTLAAAVGELAHCYRERRVAIITFIASRPMENVRAFSDAFRLGGRKEE